MNATIAFDALANAKSEVVITTPCPYEFASESSRQAVRGEVKTMGYNFLDWDNVLYDPNGSGNLRWIPTYRIDGTHPNKAGCIDMAQYSFSLMLGV